MRLSSISDVFETPPLFPHRYRNENKIPTVRLAVTPNGDVGAAPLRLKFNVNGGESEVVTNIGSSHRRDRALGAAIQLGDSIVDGLGKEIVSRTHPEIVLPSNPNVRTPKPVSARKPELSPNRDQSSGLSSFEEFKDYGDVFKNGLSDLGYPNATPILTGRSARNAGVKKGTLGYNNDPNDFELAIIDPDLFNKLQELGVPLDGPNNRTAPLTGQEERFAEQVGLTSLQNELSKMAGGGNTSFVVYKNVDALVSSNQAFRKFP